MLMNRNIELLAPAGNFEALVAAVQNGADAVYLGGNRFGARAFAGNFSNEEIAEAIRYAHIRGVKVYITVNTLISDDDFIECLDFISFLYNHDADAVILQDLGLAANVHKLFPDFEIHASTQMSISNLQDALYYKSAGFKRLVLARENSVEEIKYIHENTGLEIESFVHGALCVSYSGKCLFSYVQGGRSANKGSCAQPCRKKYIAQDPKGKNFPENYFLSTKDLCTIQDLRQIIENGTHSLKIEGRMKKPEYVATVVRNYRKAIDSIIHQEPIDTEKLEFEMASIFNRKFTKGLILGELPKHLANSESPNNRGIDLGKVIKVDSKNKKIHILLDTELRKGDGLSLGEYVGRIFVNGNLVEKADAKQIVILDYIGNAKAGDTVRKTSDKKIIDLATESLKKENIKIDLSAIIDIHGGENPRIQISDSKGNVVNYSDCSEFVTEAKTHPLTKEDIVAQITKTEDTPYRFSKIDIFMDSNAFLKKSTLNSLRRNALADLSKIREKNHIRTQKTISLPMVHHSNYSWNESILPEMIRVKCFTKEQIEVCKEIGIQKIYTEHYENYLFAKDQGIQVAFCTPVMLKDYQIKELDDFINKHSPDILTTSLGYAKYISKKYSKKNLDRAIHLDYLFNLYNRYTLQEISALNFLESAALSLEHPFYTSQHTGSSFFENIELPVYIHPILMVTEYCPNKKTKPCLTCRIDGKKFCSEDKKSSFTISKDFFCRMQLIDNRALDFTKLIKSAKKFGIKKYRIDFLHEGKQEATNIINKVLGN